MDTRRVDRQSRRAAADYIAATTSRGLRRQRGQIGAQSWQITETVPGTFRVVTNKGDYAVWYYAGPERWACSCPDFAEPFGMANKLGIECKHIFGVQARADLVDPDTETPLSLMGPGEGDDTPPQTSQHEKETTMQDAPFTQEVAKALAAPFPLMAHSFKAGATSRDGQSALALTYVDSRLYQARLDEVDPAWQSEYEVIALPDRILVNCKLTVRGVTREDVGECLLLTQSRGDVVPEENAYTSAVAQAFKRVCAQFGLGRYLYDLPKIWAGYDRQKRSFTVDGLAKLRQRLAQATGGTAGPEAPRRQSERQSQPRPSPNGAASAEQKNAVRRLLEGLGYRDQVAQDDALTQAGFARLVDLTAEQAAQVVTRLETATARAAATGDNGR